MSAPRERPRRIPSKRTSALIGAWFVLAAGVGTMVLLAAVTVIVWSGLQQLAELVAELLT